MIKKLLIIACNIILCLSISACSAQNTTSSEQTTSEASEHNSAANANEQSNKQIKITDANDNIIIFELNNSTAANDLYAQLPLEIDVEDYSDNEKIFYPNELNTENTPLAQNKIGTLAYYAPWKDVVMFYGEFRQNDKLFELGHVVSGEELIPNLSGKIKIEALK